MSINPRKFNKVDGILLEDENGENYPRIINQNGKRKKSLEEDFRKEQDEREKLKRPEECVLSDRQICENIHYLYYKMKSDFLNQFMFEILEDVIMEDEMKKLGKHKENREAKDIYSDSE